MHDACIRDLSDHTDTKWQSGKSDYDLHGTSCMVASGLRSIFSAPAKGLRPHILIMKIGASSISELILIAVKATEAIITIVALALVRFDSCYTIKGKLTRRRAWRWRWCWARCRGGARQRTRRQSSCGCRGPWRERVCVV